MKYTVRIPDKIHRTLARIKGKLTKRIGDAIDRLEYDPRPHGCLKLKGSDEWRIRVGQYRIRYTIDDTSRTVRITRVSPRDDAYSE